MTCVHPSLIPQIWPVMSTTHAHTNPLPWFFLARILSVDLCSWVTINSYIVHPQVFAFVWLGVCLQNLGAFALTLLHCLALVFTLVLHTPWRCMTFSSTQILYVFVKLSLMASELVLTSPRCITMLPTINLSLLGGYDSLLGFVQAQLIFFINHGI